MSRACQRAFLRGLPGSMRVGYPQAPPVPHSSMIYERLSIQSLHVSWLEATVRGGASQARNFQMLPAPDSSFLCLQLSLRHLSGKQPQRSPSAGHAHNLLSSARVRCPCSSLQSMALRMCSFNALETEKRVTFVTWVTGARAGAFLAKLEAILIQRGQPRLHRDPGSLCRGKSEDAGPQLQMATL